MSTPAQLREALLAALAFEPQGAAAGNVTVGKGQLLGRHAWLALVENRTASGAIGKAEAERLRSMLQVAMAEKAPVVLFLDSAGAKVSEGLQALGSFRHLYSVGLAAALSGIPMAAVLGRNCYGGSSMLAHLAPRRLLSAATQMAMSGPAVIASASGMDPLDEMFRAMADATLSSSARAKVSPANTVWEEGASVQAWLEAALVPSKDRIGEAHARHKALAARFATPPAPRPWETVRRKDLEKIYERCDTRESEGVLDGVGVRDGAEERILGLVGKAALSATRALRFSATAWGMLEAPPARVEVFLDCASHAARLDDEKVILTEYVVDMGMALAALGARGTRVGLTVCGKAGGGVYVALAAPAQKVASLYGAEIQVLPGSAVAAILGESRDATPAFDEYRKAGVADLEIKLGIVPGNA